MQRTRLSETGEPHADRFTTSALTARRLLTLALAILAACGDDANIQMAANPAGAGGSGGAAAAGGMTQAAAGAGAGAGTSGTRAGAGAGTGSAGRAGSAAGRDAGAGGAGMVASGDDAGMPPTTEPTEPGRTDLPALCSGCPSETRDMMDTSVRLHHVHLNVKNVDETVAYYAKFFGTKAVWLNESKTAIWADPILFLLDVVDHDLVDTLEMGLEHAGMGVQNVEMWYQQQQGLMVDTRNGAPSTPSSVPTVPGVSPFLDPEVDTFAYVYIRGPNNERIEVWSGLKRFRHVHFMTSNIDETVSWYTALLGIQPVTANAAANLGAGNGIELANDVQMFYASTPALPRFVPSDDRPVGHVAFSVSSLDPMLAKAKSLNLKIVSEPKQTDQGFRSFFVRGPQEALLEFVEAGPVNMK